MDVLTRHARIPDQEGGRRHAPDTAPDHPHVRVRLADRHIRFHAMNPITDSFGRGEMTRAAVSYAG
jgi:hypothetical protein